MDCRNKGNEGRSMKRKERKQENRIVKYVVLASVLLVACLCVFAGSYLYLSENAERNISENAESGSLEKEAGAAKANEALARNFLNQPAREAADGDKREVIRIVEVIPHEICSMFPYLVEWGSKEEYDRQTPIGYEGILYMTAASGLAPFGSAGGNTKGIYSLDKEGIKEYTLRDYNVQFTDKNSTYGAYWWRETVEKSILTANGYFEYVGEGKGLYNINLDGLVDEEKKNGEYGIRYRTMAMERAGTEPPKGEWQVNEPEYFWAKDSNTNYPTTNIQRLTDYNYDLKFEPVTGSSSEKQYKVKNVYAKLDQALQDGNKYEYQAKLKAGEDWTGGYAYWPEGNYSVGETSIRKYIVTAQDVAGDKTGLAGKYIRIINDKKSDGLAGYEPGYFRPFNLEKDGSAIKKGDVLYDLQFEAVKPGTGMYVLNPSEVNSVDKSKLEFVYAGEKKGTCAVTFIYTGTQSGETVYCAEIVGVTQGEGDYALTSSAPLTEELYIKKSGERGDYSKVVTRIDCANIDFSDNTFLGYNSGGGSYSDCKGLRMGCDRYDVSKNQERGAWVFHTVSSDKKEKNITKIEDLEGKNPRFGDKIYVYNQKRYERYYARHGFKNNEWFKLLVYLSDSSDTKSLAADDYQTNMTGQQIIKKYRENLDEFDSTYRIEIIQRTPSALTADEVNNADLIYISDQEGVYGMSWNWDGLNTYLGGILPAKPNEVKFTDDLNDEALLAIYNNCLYHEDGKTPTTALIVGCMNSIWGNNGANYVDTNLGKLSYMIDLFEDPADFAHFIDGYSENKAHYNNGDGYSTIKSNASVTLYPNNVNGNDCYNQGIKYCDKYNKDMYGKEIEPISDHGWKWQYFMVYDLIDHTTYIEVRQTSSEFAYKSLNGGFRADGISAYKQDVKDGWTWFVPVTSGDAFSEYGKMNNVWKIMHQRTSKKSSTPRVVVTNSDEMREPDLQNGAVEYYFYRDEFMLTQTDAFCIDYKVIFTPEEISNPSALTSIEVKRASGGVVQTQGSPSYNTEYTCDVRGDFVNGDGTWNGQRMVQYLITATDEKGKSDTVSVFVIMRDSFMLN